MLDLQNLLRTKFYGGGANQFVNLHKFTRVNRFFIETYFVMEVRAGGATAVAQSSNGLASFDFFSTFNKTFLQMGKSGAISIAMAYFNILAIISVKKGSCYNSIGCCHDFLTIGSSNVNAGMKCFFSIERIDTITKSGRDNTGCGVSQWKKINCFHVVIRTEKKFLADGIFWGDKRAAGVVAPFGDLFNIDTNITYDTFNQVAPFFKLSNSAVEKDIFFLLENIYLFSIQILEILYLQSQVFLNKETFLELIVKQSYLVV